jgi:hypothetical protein
MGWVQQRLPPQIGNYTILERLAVGGMAEVFLGRTAGVGGFEKLVAIKRVLPQFAGHTAFVEMFLDEARIAAKLNHSNIVQIFDLGRWEDSFYIAMEYVAGVGLMALHRHFLANQGCASGPLAAYIVMNICTALDHAHTKRDSDGSPLNIIHRDVSPSNVMISFEGDIKLIDFGIARADQRLHETRVGDVKGKMGYISPEQLRGLKADVRSDIYSTGVVLLGLLTNRFTRDWQPPLPAPSSLVDGVPPELEAVCVKAVAVDPDDRYQTAAVMGAALEEYWRRTPFTRSHFSAWLKESFAEDYERQMHVTGMPPRPASPLAPPSASAATGPPEAACVETVVESRLWAATAIFERIVGPGPTEAPLGPTEAPLDVEGVDGPTALRTSPVSEELAETTREVSVTAPVRRVRSASRRALVVAVVVGVLALPALVIIWALTRSSSDDGTRSPLAMAPSNDARPWDAGGQPVKSEPIRVLDGRVVDRSLEVDASPRRLGGGKAGPRVYDQRKQRLPPTKTKKKKPKLPYEQI